MAGHLASPAIFHELRCLPFRRRPPLVFEEALKNQAYLRVEASWPSTAIDGDEGVHPFPWLEQRLGDLSQDKANGGLPQAQPLRPHRRAECPVEASVCIQAALPAAADIAGRCNTRELAAVVALDLDPVGITEGDQPAPRERAVLDVRADDLLGGQPPLPRVDIVGRLCPER